MSLNSAPRTWVVSELVTAAEMNAEIRDALTNLQAAWSVWNPTASTGLTLGNGTLTGQQTRWGKTIVARWSLTLGSSTAITGFLTFQFPVAIQSSYAILDDCGHAGLGDASVGAAGRFPAGLEVNDTTTGGVGKFHIATTSGQLTTTVPFAWAVSDHASGTLFYEAA